MTALTLFILGVVFLSSLRHIHEAWKKQDISALGEGIGTMLFSGMMIVLHDFWNIP